MELDEQGRIVKRPPPPGQADVDPDPGFPIHEHNQWTFEGEIERLGTFARGVNRARGVPRWIGVFLALAVLFPFAVVAVAMLVDLLD